MHNIVILGGNWAGVSTAHYLLRHVLPLLRNEKSQYTVTLVSPSTQTFFNVGAPRALVSEKVANAKPFASILDAFSEYKSSEFTFIQGEAVGVDGSAKTVSLKSVVTSDRQLIRYDSLVIATGSTSASPLWTLHGDHKVTLAAFQDIKTSLPSAKTILIAGGGPSGVETAGEIAYLYRNKDITLLSGGMRLLPRFQNDKPGKKAEQQLASLNVRILHNVRVTSSNTAQGDEVLVVLSDGTARTVDMFIDATGGAPNTSFLPTAWLDGSKRVATDMGTLRSTKAPAGVYAIGDAASYSKGTVPDATWAVPALGYSIWSDLHRAATKDGSLKEDTVGMATLKEKKYKQFEKDMGIVPVGPEGGVGVLFGWSVPSFLVWLLKARTFTLDKAAGLANGSDFLKP
ncbi:hypothetical protein VE04_08313 [Pseudogymnoascus sp. 24MN13]|nr:hypothetical protein VE04_08313 [Pseudogymnoascus sp. 24MN13]